MSFLLSLFLLQLFAGILTLLWMTEKWSEKKKAIDRFHIFLLIFGAARLLAIGFSEFPEQSVQSFYKEALFYFSFFSFSFYLKSFDETSRKIILYLFIAGGIIAAIVGILRFNLSIVERAESFSSGYATFSTYLLMVLAVVLSTIRFKSKIKAFGFYYVIATVIILTGIITSLGRANLAIAVLLLIISFFLFRIKLVYAPGIIIITGLLVYISFFNNSIQVEQRIESPVQLSDRDIIYEGASEIAFEHPFLGYGPRTFREIFPFPERFADKGIGSWHNDLLEMYFEGGAVGLLTYLLMIIGIYTVILRFILKNKTQTEDNFILEGILLSLTGLYLSAFVAGFINSPVLSVVFAFLVSFAGSIIFQRDHKQRSEIEPGSEATIN